MSGGCEESVGILLSNIATSLTESAVHHRPVLAHYVVEKKIANMVQLDAAFKYFKTKDNFDAPLFEKLCGVGAC